MPSQNPPPTVTDTTSSSQEVSRWRQWGRKVKKSGHHTLNWLKIHPWQGLLYGLILLMLVELSGIGNLLLQRFEDWHFAIRQQNIHENRSHSRITIVGLDDYTLSLPAVKKLFGRYPFQRSIYGVVVDFMARANAESVFFDFGFSGGEDMDHPESDQYFTEKIYQALEGGNPLPVFTTIVANTDINTSTDTRYAPVIEHMAWQAYPTAPLKDVGQMAMQANTFGLPYRSLGQSPMRLVFTNDALHDGQGQVRYCMLFTRIEKHLETAYPTIPLTLALQRQYLAEHPGVKSPLFPPPKMWYADDTKGTPLSWQWQTEPASPPHELHFHHRVFPIIRWYGDARGSGANSNLSDLAKQFGVMSPYKLLGPIGRTLLSEPTEVYQWSVRQKQVYPIVSLWDVVFTQLHHQCHTNSASSYLCPRFLDLENAGELSGNLLDLERFQNQSILLGTNYQNAPGDAHKTIYSGNYPGVYIVANLVDNILHDDFVQPAPTWTAWLATGILMLMIGWTSYTRPVVYSTLFSAVLVLAYTLLTFWMYQEQNIWLAWAMPFVASVATFILSFGVRYWVTENRKQQLRFAFGKYVSRNVMQTIEANPEAITLGGQRRRLTFMFTDIRGFTTYSENHSPEQVQAVLTRYFQTMHRIILRDHQGVINKLIGDAIMAYWGFPLRKNEDALNAVQAALAMRRAMEAWQQDPNNPPLRIGVGIHTGEAVIGNVGSEEFMDFTVIGDAVNVTSRLEGETKHLLPEQPCAILLSEATYLEVKDTVACRPLGEILVKGKTEPIRVYEPL